ARGKRSVFLERYVTSHFISTININSNNSFRGTYNRRRKTYKQNKKGQHVFITCCPFFRLYSSLVLHIYRIRWVSVMIKLSELQIKEVIIIDDCKRLGHIHDLEIDPDNGMITAIIIAV